MNKFNMPGKLLYVSFFLILCGSTLYVTNNYRAFYYPCFIVGLTGLVFTYAKYPFCPIKNNGRFLLVVFFLFVSMIISMSLTASKAKDMLVETMGFIVFSSCCLVVFPYFKINLLKPLYYSTSFVGLFVIFIPLLVNMNISIPYKGIFYNPNSLGNIAASFYGLFFSVYISKLYSKKTDYILLLLSIVFLFLTSISVSRGSFGSVILISIILIYIYTKEKKTKYIYRLFIFIFFFLFFYFFTGYVKTSEAIMNKMNHLENNITNGRADIWLDALRNITAWGHGRERFSNIKIGYHNSYIGFLSIYGLIPFIFFITVLIKMLFQTYKSMIRNWRDNSNSAYSAIPFSSGIIFLSLSMAEGMLMSFIMLLFFLSYSSIFKNKM